MGCQLKCLEQQFCEYLASMRLLFGRMSVVLRSSLVHESKTEALLTSGVFITLAYGAMHLLLVEKR